MLRLQKATVADILREAEAGVPHEVVGFVWAAKGVQHVEPLRNTHPDPNQYYSVDDLELTRVYRKMDQAEGWPVGFYHSHPGGKPDPSEQDMIGAMNVGMHYLIAYPDYFCPDGMCEPVWRLSVWHCIEMQVLVSDDYEVGL
jgi:proteasome lid subunit RPN8/RPN11